MPEQSLHIYQSKIKLILNMVKFLLIITGGYFWTYMLAIKQLYLEMVLILCLTILLSIPMVALVRKLIRNQPIFTITNSYIQLDPETKNKITI